MNRMMALAVAILAVVSACDGIVYPDPTIPELIAPAQEAVLDNGCQAPGTDPVVWEFDWSDVEGATEYHLRVEGPNAIYPLIDGTTPLSRLHHVWYGYVAGHNLHNWRWRVRARIDDRWMEWTPEGTFHVEPAIIDCA